MLLALYFHLYGNPNPEAMQHFLVMPWNPEWEAEGAAGNSASGSVSADQGYEHANGEGREEGDDDDGEEETNGRRNNHQPRQNGRTGHVEDSQDEQEEEEEEWEGDQMDVDDELPEEHQLLDLTPQRDSDTTPIPKQRVFGLAVPKSERFQVVLHSSPKKVAYTVITQEELSADELVTADVLPSLRPHGFYGTGQQTLKSSKVNEIERSASNTSEPTDDTAQSRKQRGRPKGWRPRQAYSTSTPGSTTSNKVKKSVGRPLGSGKAGRPSGKLKPDGESRGRPGRKPAQTARDQYKKLNPKFPVFICEWEGCPAQLHNLETLRKHIFIVHGQPEVPPAPSSSSSAVAGPDEKHSDDGLIVCKWAKCISSPTPRFQDDFRTHVEEVHLVPFAWHCGDGPQNTSVSPKPEVMLPALPKYLFDEEGRQVTPSVADQQLETDEDKRRRVSKIAALTEKANENAPDEPEYDEKQMELIIAFMEKRNLRQRELKKYAEWVTGEGVILPVEEKEERDKWRGRLR
ncbi:hypothetical protein QC762_308750 [Podospora pseudocomata]|uniref:C2H2-type domain-containing protein n=1 Tax=Podospora pseudocomata TaxID=2093779 RepID=A0ABR0GK99_9PEZI|nr:hypothetical protein QC762_308750 [Podospora pseudocomata]